MDSLSYDQLGQKVFGSKLSGGWRLQSPKKPITSGERVLLDALMTMPPGGVPHASKRKVRPSSAAAKLQTHKSFFTGLFDDNKRTATGSGGNELPFGPSGLVAHTRPKTQAGGPRYQWGSQSQSDTVNLPGKLQQRRLTVGAVDGLADTDAAYRKGALLHIPAIAGQLKGKVRW